MKSFCASGMVLFVSLSWTASSAHAQGGAYATPSLLPLPAGAPLQPTGTPASYNAANNRLEPFASSFVAQNPAPDMLPAVSPAPATASMDESLHCGDCGDGCNQCCGGTWFGSIGGLAMGRNRANPYWTTFQTNNNPNQLLNTQNAGANWGGGGQVTAGYSWCCCGGPALAFTYWGVGPMTGSASIRDSNNLLSTPMDVGGVNIGNFPASAFFDNAREHRITRSDRINNFEVNLLQGSLLNTGRLQFTALAGFRYFRFDERLDFSSVAGGFEFGDNGGIHQATLAIRAVNNLFGFQIGGNFNYLITNRWAFFVTPKAGIFGNQMNVRTQLYRGDGLSVYDIAAHKSDVSFLGEIDTGFNYAFTQNLRGYIGYRIVGVSNVALSDNQFLPFLADQGGFAQVKQNGDLILHGGFAGIAWTF